MVWFWVLMLALLSWQSAKLYYEQKHRDLIAFVFFWLLATSYATLFLLGVRLPSPFDLISRAVDFLFN